MSPFLSLISILFYVKYLLVSASTPILDSSSTRTLKIHEWTPDSLEDYSRRSDCFRKAAGSIRTRCAELYMNEEERVVAAISMTLCELATAKHHAPPLECNIFSLHLREGLGSYGDRSAESDVRGDCVNALSRSAQFWSSYSGYLREVPQLCFTFQRENDIDNAKDIFRNISLNQEIFLRKIIDREQANELHTERWSLSLADLSIIVDELHLLPGQFRFQSSGAVEEIQRHSIEVLDTLMGSFNELRNQAVEDRKVQVVQINSALGSLSEQHTQELQAIVPRLEDSLYSLLSQTFQLAQRRHETIVDEMTATTRDQWRILYSEFSALQEVISQLSLSTASAAISLDSVSKQTVQEMYQARQLILDSAQQFNHVLVDLTGRTLEHMVALDVAAIDLKDKLLPPHPRGDSFSYENVNSERWWKSNMIRVLGFLLGGTSLSAWTNSPFLKILELVWIIVFWLLRRSLSAVTGFIVLCFSCRKYIHQLLVSSSSRSYHEQNQLVGEGRLFRDHHNSLTSLYDTPSVRGNAQVFSPTRITPARTNYTVARTKISRIPDRLCTPRSFTG